MAKQHMNIGIIGHYGYGKSTLTEAIARVLSRRYGSGQPAKIREPEMRQTKQRLSVKMRTVECETPERAYTLVDCNSYTDWVKTIIGGEPRLDAAILVVSGEDGPGAQATELLLMAQDAGVPHMLVFFNQIGPKKNPDERQLMETAVDSLLQSTGYNEEITSFIWGDAYDAGTFPKGENGEAVAKLMELADKEFPAPFRGEPLFLMAAEDSFSVPGRGTVASGTVEEGSASVGDVLEIVGMDERIRKAEIIGISKGSKTVKTAETGELAGLLLKGVERQELQRGQVLAVPGAIDPHRDFVAQIYILEREEGGSGRPFVESPLYGFRFRTADLKGVAHPLGDPESFLMPGTACRIQVELTRPAAMREGDRFMIMNGRERVAVGFVAEVTDKIVPYRERPVLKAASADAPKRETASAPKKETAPSRSEKKPEKRPVLEAREWFRKGVEARKRRDYKEAVRCYEEAAKMGYAPAQHRMGFVYEVGEGVEEDLEKARAWYEKAAAQGHEESRDALMMMEPLPDLSQEPEKTPEELNAEGLRHHEAKNYDEALPLFRKAAERGHAAAQNNLGLYHYHGWGTEKRFQKSGLLVYEGRGAGKFLRPEQPG